ncbi:MAG: hypothetical protein ACYCU0_03325 [Solirubrobacteraceae bacterium]
MVLRAAGGATLVARALLATTASGAAASSSSSTHAYVLADNALAKASERNMRGIDAAARKEAAENAVRRRHGYALLEALNLNE